ncbi:MAG: alpha/beta fold hydrolase BchO [Geminicoccaceae bacterium]
MSGARFVPRLKEMQAADTAGQDGPRWDVEGRDWPNREFSRFVTADGLRWHVQILGTGPVLLLVHGTGAASHSWGPLVPFVAPHFTVVTLDLPGHGFTALPAAEGLSLAGMARGVGRLMQVLGLQPEIAVGHSAGAAILLRAAIDGDLAPKRIISVNGALLPFGGGAAQFFSPLAKLVASTSLVPRLFAWHATVDEALVRRLIENTGSKVDPEIVDQYRRIARHPRHVAAALGMMAGWDLRTLVADLPRCRQHVLFVVGANDRAVAPREATRVSSKLPSAEVVRLPGLGHLAHEERPDLVADLVLQQARAANILTSD